MLPFRLPTPSALAFMANPARSRSHRFLGFAGLIVLLALLSWMAPTAWADTPPPTVVGVATPTTPSYIDPMMLQITVSTSPASSVSGTINYSVDSGATQTATVTNGLAEISLGTFAIGPHSVSYQFTGSIGTTSFQQSTFTTTDLPFKFIGTEQTVISNHGGFLFTASDSKNNILLTNYNENNLYKLDPQRNLTVVPTTGLSMPQGIVLDSSDNIFIADTGNNRVVELTPAGVQTVLGVTGLTGPTTLAFDPNDANLYINDLGNGRIAMYNLATAVTSTVVTGIPRITGLAFDTSGDLYFGQRYSYQDGALFKLDTFGNITTGYFALRSPEGVTADGSGNIYVTDDYSGLNRIDTQGHLIHYESYYSGGISVDYGGQIYIPGIYSYVFTPGTTAKMANASSTGLGGANSGPSNNTIVYQVPSGQTLTAEDYTTGSGGNLGRIGGVSCEISAQCSFAVQFGPNYPGPHIGYVVGTLSNGATLQTNFGGVGFNSYVAFDPGVRSSATVALTSAGGIAEAEDTTIYVSDTKANKVYSLGVGGATAPVALAFTGLNGPTQLAVDGSKTVYVLDTGNNRVVQVDANGNQNVVYTASNGNLITLTAMAFDPAGRLYLGGDLDEFGSCIAIFNPDGSINPIIKLANDPTLIGSDGVGGIYETDNVSSTLRKATYSGRTPGAILTATTVATGIGSPTVMTVEPSGTVFLGQGTAGTVLQVRPDGTQTPYYSGLGTASAIIEDDRGVFTLVDGLKGNIQTIDRRNGLYAFPNQTVNTTSPPLLGTISNFGNMTLASIGGEPGNTNFIQVTEANACGMPAAGSTSVAIGSFCHLDYTFMPTNVTSYSQFGTHQDSSYSPSADFSDRQIQFTGNGVAGPLAVVTPASVPFGNQPINTTSLPQNVTLTNSGSATLNISSIALMGAGYTISNNTCGNTLNQGSACMVSLTFTPTATGAVSGSLVFIDNSTDIATQTVTLSGTGTAPALTANPASVSFPATKVNTTATGIMVTLTNNGTAAANLNTTIGTLGGADATAFSVGSGCGYNLAPGASCILTFTFTPAAVRTFNATFSVPSNDSKSPLVIPLTGNGLTAGSLTIAPIMQVFPNTAVSSSSAIQTSAITNSTSQAIYLSGGSLTDATDFTQSDNCSGLLAAGGTCTVTFTFAPKAAGTLTSTYAIHDLNNPASPLTVALSGNGTTPQAALTPATFAYSSMTAGTTSATQNFTLLNAGSAPLTITSISLGGANAASFTIASNNCGNSLATGSSCTVGITFSPAAAGTFSASLSVVDAVGTQTSTLTATATSVPTPQAVLSPAALTFSGTSGTVSALQTLMLSNTGTASLTITSIGLGGANTSSFAESTTCGGTLGIGGSCAITVTFNPSTVGTFTASVIATDNSGSTGAVTTTQSSILTGTSTAAPAPQATLTPATASFGSVTIGKSSAVQIFTLSNPGTAALSISSVSLTGANASSFSLSANTCVTALAAGASCTVSATFNPATIASFSASLSVVDAVGTQTSALAGTGAAVGATPPDFTLAATTASQSSYRGRTVSYTFLLASLVSTNPFNSAVTLSVAGLPSGATASFAPATITPGTSQQSATLTVNIPALSAQAAPADAPHKPRTEVAGVAFAALFAGLVLQRRRRRLPRMLTLLLLFAGLGSLSVMATGCGMSNGFDVPTSTSTLTVTGTSGATIHSTSVTLTVQ